MTLLHLGVTFDSKMTFEKQIRTVSRAASQRLGILRKSWRMFHDRSLFGRCFRGFVLPVLLLHDLLLNKLVQLNIDSTWFACYLHDRTHSIKIDKILSEA